MDWKIIAALVVAVAIVVSGFFASGGVGGIGAPSPSGGTNPIGDLFAGVKDALSGLVSGSAAGNNSSGTVRVSGSLEMLDNSLTIGGPADSVEVHSNSSYSIIAGSEKVDVPSGSAAFDKFLGKAVIYANGTIYIEGSAEKISVNGMMIYSNSRRTVSASAAASADSAKIYGTSIGALALNVSGSLGIGQESAGLSIPSGPLQISDFRGNLTVSGANIGIDGFSSKIILNGRQKVVVG